MLPTAQEVATRLALGSVDAERLRDPELNLRLGAEYLAGLLRRFRGDEALALAAYNAGPTHARRWAWRSAAYAGRDVVRREAYPATRAYVERVLAAR
jgi:soluble lytic murein transglycosylase